MKSSMGLSVHIEREMHKLRNEDPDQIVDEFDITTEELMFAFRKRIADKLTESYYGDEEEGDEEG